MADTEEQWPPAPTEFPRKTPDKTDAETCPSCGRKLLTMMSVLCNWCGAVIDNEEYQQRAAEARHAKDAAERERLEQEISETARHGVLGRLKQKGKLIQRNPDKLTDLLVTSELADKQKTDKEK